MRNPFSSKRPQMIENLNAARTERDALVTCGVDAKLAQIKSGKWSYADLLAFDAMRAESVLVAQRFRSSVHSLDHAVSVAESQLRADSDDFKNFESMRLRLRSFAEQTRTGFRPKLETVVELTDVFKNKVEETSTTLDRVLLAKTMADISALSTRLEDLRLTATSAKHAQTEIDLIASDLAKIESIVFETEGLDTDGDGNLRETPRKRARADKTGPSEVVPVTLI